MSVNSSSTKHDYDENKQRQLIAAAKTGRQQAFEQLITHYETRMFGLARSLSMHEDDAEDVYQEAMIKAFKAINTYRFESEFSTWLYRIVVNTTLSYKRQLKRRLARFISSEHHEEGHELQSDKRLGENENPEKALQTTQLKRAIHKALQTLANNERLAFVLCHQQGLKITEAANIMTCSDGAIKSYLFRARDKLRVELAPHAHE